MESNHHMATFHELFVRVKPSCAENMAHGGLNQRLGGLLRGSLPGDVADYGGGEGGLAVDALGQPVAGEHQPAVGGQGDGADPGGGGGAIAQVAALQGVDDLGGGGGDGAGSCGTPTERGATFKSLGLGSGCETAFTGTDDAATAAAIPTHGLPKLRGYLITRWWRDPFARGSWTFFPPHSVPRHYSDMAAPVASTLFFAGEHTCVAAQGCAHGAFMSGDAAAAQVLHALARQGMAAKGVSGAGKQ